MAGSRSLQKDGNKTWRCLIVLYLSERYQFVFNGQEKDDEVSSEGNSIAYELRIYESR